MPAALLDLMLDSASDWVGKQLCRAASALKRGVVRLGRSGRAAGPDPAQAAAGVLTQDC